MSEMLKQPKLKSNTDKEWAEYHRMRALDLERRLKIATEALEKIVKDGCMAITINGSIRDVYCVKTARAALKEIRDGD